MTCREFWPNYSGQGAETTRSVVRKVFTSWQQPSMKNLRAKRYRPELGAAELAPISAYFDVATCLAKTQ